ncbi:MAG: hypothetical protein ACOX8Q_06780 [Christensenellales bacterium]|jgi:hypothetical protein
MSCLCDSYNYPNSTGNVRNRLPQLAGQTQMPMQALPRNMQTRPMAQSPLSGTVPIVPTSNEPTTVQNPYYTAGFLKNFLGRNMRVEFLVGTSGALVDRIGVLMEVGASYIVLQPIQTDDLLMCDLYSIKFVTIYG